MGGLKYKDVDEFEKEFDEQTRVPRQQAWSKGNWSALYDAVVQALEDLPGEGGETDAPLQVPRWALRALVDEVLPEAMRKANRRPEAEGRPALWTTAWKRDQIDAYRYRQVMYRKIARREHGPPRPTPRDAAKQRVAHHDLEASRQSLLSGVDMFTPYPWTLNRDSEPDDMNVYEAVAKLLEGTIYEATPSSVKHSYERVTKALKNGEGWRYYPSRWARYDERQALFF